MNTKVIGRKGEFFAERFLKKKGYKILERNYQNKLGEIDLICRHKKTTVFVEVKLRESKAHGLPCEAVTPAKQNKIRGVATMYLQINNLIDSSVRFDVVEILGDELSHIENAF